jgi:very-short-patch-repair endonuclease
MMGIRVHRSIPLVREAMSLGGVPCTTAARTAIDLARTLPRSLALATLDCALANGACTRDALAAEAARHRTLPGSRQATELVEKADGRAQCTQETQLRLTIHDAGLRGFEPQVEVMDNGVKKYVLDLADIEHKVAAEYDGISHDEPRRRQLDRERHNWLDAHGWRMRYFTDVDLYRRPWRIIRDLRTAIAQPRRQ